MFDVVLENSRGQKINFKNNPNYTIYEIDGLYPTGADIFTSQLSLYDGSKFNSSKVKNKSINIALVIERNAEENRLALYKVIKPKNELTMYYKSNLRDVYIKGYVENIICDYFAKKQTVTISMLCVEPYFKNINSIVNDVNSVVAKFHFPFAIEKEKPIPFSYIEQELEYNIYYEGDIECGIKIEISASGEVINPIIYNKQTRKYLGVNFTMQKGDKIEITTFRGNKTIRLLRNAEYTNIFNNIKENSSWLQLSNGDNIFTYEADEETTSKMSVRFIHQPLYEGV